MASVVDGPTSADDFVRRYWADYAATGSSPGRYVLRHPRRHLQLLHAVRRLPIVKVEAPPDTPDGAELRRTLALRGLRWHGLAVLDIPAEPGAFIVGRTKKTLRRQTRAAEAAGLRARLVPDEERTELLALANEAEQYHPNPAYKFEQPANDDLLGLSLWLVVVDAENVPILLAVVPVVGECSTLRYFRTLGWSRLHSRARYLGTTALVEELGRRGVRHLLDTTHPAALPNGLRHFQRMVGFHYARPVLTGHETDRETPLT